MTEKPDLKAAYDLNGPEDSKALYADWAPSYDSSFAERMQYRAPQVVAKRYASLSGATPLLDLGAGTGLVAQALKQHGITDVHGTDISPEMLEQAKQKALYTHLFEGDLTQRLDVEDGQYNGIVSAGIFTHGHVGPEALGEVLRCMARGAWAVLSVNAHHWDAHDFAATLTALAPKLSETRKDLFELYGPDAEGDHANDKGWLLQMRKA